MKSSFRTAASLSTQLDITAGTLTFEVIAKGRLLSMFLRRLTPNLYSWTIIPYFFLRHTPAEKCPSITPAIFSHSRIYSIHRIPWPKGTSRAGRDDFLRRKMRKSSGWQRPHIVDSSLARCLFYFIKTLEKSFPLSMERTHPKRVASSFPPVSSLKRGLTLCS